MGVDWDERTGLGWGVVYRIVLVCIGLGRKEWFWSGEGCTGPTRDGLVWSVLDRDDWNVSGL